MQELILEHAKHDIATNGLDNYSDEDIKTIFPEICKIYETYSDINIDEIERIIFPVSYNNIKILEEICCISGEKVTFDYTPIPNQALLELFLYLESLYLYEIYGKKIVFKSYSKGSNGEDENNIMNNGDVVRLFKRSGIFTFEEIIAELKERGLSYLEEYLELSWKN